MSPSLRRLLASACAVLALGLPAGASEPGGVSPAARLSRADAASEYWDLAALFDSGYRVFARVSVSNEGPGRETAYAVGQIVFPDGAVVPFKNGRLKGNWQHSDDGLQLTIGSTLLDWREPGRFEVDKSKAGIKLFLRFEPPRPGQVWRSAPSGYGVNLVTADAKVSGSLWVRGRLDEPVALRGSLSATHVWMEQSEMELALRRTELRSRVVSDEGAGSASVYLLDLTAPDGGRKAWLVVRGDAGQRFESSEVEVRFEGSGPGSKAGYPVPERMLLSGPGIRGEIALSELLVEHDPLALAPKLFRWFLSLRARPSHLWLAASFRLAVEPEPGAAPIELVGSGATSIFFLNPLASGR